MKNKGQLSIWGILIPAGATLFASALGAWGMSSIRVGAIDTEIQVVNARESAHYEEVQKQLTVMSKGIDEISKSQSQIINILLQKR